MVSVRFNAGGWEGERLVRRVECEQEANAEILTVASAENNKDSKPGEIDLHGLYVKEAIHFTERAIQEARARGDSQVNLIVGASIHVVNVHPGSSDLVFPLRDR